MNKTESYFDSNTSCNPRCDAFYIPDVSMSLALSIWKFCRYRENTDTYRQAEIQANTPSHSARWYNIKPINLPCLILRPRNQPIIAQYQIKHRLFVLVNLWQTAITRNSLLIHHKSYWMVVYELWFLVDYTERWNWIFPNRVGITSRISPESSLVIIIMDVLTENIEKDPPWAMMFVDDLWKHGELCLRSMGWRSAEQRQNTCRAPQMIQKPQ